MESQIDAVQQPTSSPSQSADVAGPAAPATSRLDVLISRHLSKLLRHGKNNQIKIPEDGYVPVKEILHLDCIRSIDMITDPTQRTKDGRKKKARKPDVADIMRIVDNPIDKARFQIKNRDGEAPLIRAMQGHSIATVNIRDYDPLTLETLHLLAYDDREVCPPGELPQGVEIIHGTKRRAWNEIKADGGLSIRGRIHLHLARGRPRPGFMDSGFRPDSPLLIHIDLIQALKDGIPFLLSPNKAILTAGEGETGKLPLKYVTKVEVQQNEGKIIWTAGSSSLGGEAA